MISRHEEAIRTPAWLLRQPETGAPELYAKPGDRWEVSEIANLCPEIVNGLQAVLAQAGQIGEAGQPPPLAESLVRAID